MKLREKPKCFVFDLDGTLCDVRHRRQWVSTQPKNWDAWNAGVPNDRPNLPVYVILKALSLAPSSYDIVLLSGRGSEYRQVTINWLRHHGVQFSDLYMRAEGDYRPDPAIKAELADEVVGVFDDRKSVVDMWLERGWFVFDVGQGKGDF